MFESELWIEAVNEVLTSAQVQNASGVSGDEKCVCDVSGIGD